MSNLQEQDFTAAWNILLSPRKYLKLCDESIVKAQTQIIDSSYNQSIKPLVHTRITAVPRRENQNDFGELVVTSGITVRISQPSIIKLMKKFSCKKCEFITEVKYDWERQTFDDVKNCKACQAKNIIQVPCLQGDDSADYQEVKIQEKCRTETSSSYNVGMQVILLDDLVDKCSPGDDVEISGVVIRRWSTLTAGKRTEISTIMIGNSVSVLRKVVDSNHSVNDMKNIFDDYWSKYIDAPLVGRDNILASICPQLFGMYTVKLALAIVLAGGVPKTNSTGVRVRGEPHLLMIGDPGTGKSQVLRTAAKLAVRSVLTTGIGTTAAGLTAAAVKDTDGWHLEGGALVLADGGVCCVDEFTTMNSNDRASLHEAMEQQTISIAKAGLVSTLNSRCSVVAAINPVGGKFIQGEEMKTRLGNPLLSRFDLILLLKDNKKREWDIMTTTHILQAACKDPEEDIKMSAKKPMDILKSEGLWKDESLREYFSHVHLLNPKLTKPAEKVLSAVFLYHRKNPNRREERTTVRLLDSLIRLAEGHARLMYKKEVDIVDAIVAAQLVGTCPNDNDAGCPFPDDPMAHCDRTMRTVLELLNLEYLYPSPSNSQDSTE
ncbi:DNA helicase MCM9-like isoform X2 [Aphidius gifuensis]|uniref:DNA helicase MCM9-like isoform X2 n=1 Tax=Aphidius gifuensis TaxID=684658 RepID=UPI001CDCF50F|nr:DNA helicase MCM9-like isoform X2 [Aphidius gifuensis]